MTEDTSARSPEEQSLIDQIAESRGEEFTGAYEVTDDGEWAVLDAAIRAGGGNQTPIIDAPTVLAIASDAEALS